MCRRRKVTYKQPKSVSDLQPYEQTQMVCEINDVLGNLWENGKPIPSTKPHIYIKVRDSYIYISTF